eukprot:scaffold74297_cov21-Tisochrysis_lutea.AAC.1
MYTHKVTKPALKLHAQSVQCAHKLANTDAPFRDDFPTLITKMGTSSNPHCHFPSLGGGNVWIQGSLTLNILFSSNNLVSGLTAYVPGSSPLPEQ